jgi:predicted transcriptional regulator
MGILLKLLESGKKLAELEEETQTRGTTILHILKELETLEIITKSNGVYNLTQLGIIEAQICKGTILSFDVLKKHKNFWLTHDISAIPPPLMRSLGVIEESNLIKSTEVYLNKVHKNFIELLLSSKTILGISPIFHPDYIEAFKVILSQGNKVKLIVTTSVFERIKQEANDMLIKYSSEGNLEMFLNDNIRIALTITEKSWSLGLFNLSGGYDYSNDLICSGEEALEWGYILFKKVLAQSTQEINKNNSSNT